MFAECVRFSTDDEILLRQTVSKTEVPKGSVDEFASFILVNYFDLNSTERQWSREI